MKLLIIRHGKAEDPKAFAKTGQSDATRPLTKAGRKQVKQAAKGLKKLIDKLDLVAASPLLRAGETAEIIAEVFDAGKVVALRELAPKKDTGALLRAIKARKKDGIIALVGHEPDLGAFTGWLLTGLHESFIPFGKASAALIDFQDDPATGHGKLQWLLKARQLKKLR